jgi:hypothetical protein
LPSLTFLLISLMSCSSFAVSWFIVWSLRNF